MSDDERPMPMTVLPQACSTCPYRKDTPSGIWDASEYKKLPDYDDPIKDPFNPTLSVFHCHNQESEDPGTVCRGWLSVHRDSIPVRLAVSQGLILPQDLPAKPDPGLYRSGKEACAAGLRGVRWPSIAALRAMAKIERLRKRAGGFPMRPLLVGETNPYGGRPEYALYPEPQGASGDRLCRLVMGLTHDEYLDRFDRVNLCVGKWSMPAARQEARRLLAARTEGAAPVVLLGRKVTEAAGFEYRPFVAHYRDFYVVVLPHPSGLNRLWNQPGAFDRAREILHMAGVLPPREK